MEEYISIYSFDQSLELKDTSPDISGELDMDAVIRSGAFGLNKSRIMDCLYKYPVVNKMSILYFLGVEENEKEVRKTSDDLRNLVSMGIVKTYMYGELILYSLADYVRKYYSVKKGFYVMVPNVLSVSEVLEYASLAQWHISIVRTGNVGLNTLYQEMTIARKKVLLPSYIEIKRGVRYRIFGLPAPRGSSVSVLLDKLSCLWELSEKSKRKDQHTLTLIVCESYKQMETMHQVLSLFEPAKTRTIYYCLDENFRENGLSALHYFQNEKIVKTIAIV